MKKKTKTTKRPYTRKAKGTPFTCVIKGAGVDIDIKLDSVGNLNELIATAFKRHDSNADYAPRPPSGAELRAGSEVFAKTLQDTDLIILAQTLVDECEARGLLSEFDGADDEANAAPADAATTANGVHTPPAEDGAAETSASA